MKYVFWGTPRFAEIILDHLINAGMPPVALVCNPDRPVGRKKIVTSPPAKQRALHASDIRVFQPEELDETLAHELKSLATDLSVVAAYARVIPKAILGVPRLGTLGIHPSLLPQYRGASPIQSAILAGERETGTTLYLMDEKMDHGPIIARERYIMDNDSVGYEALEKKLAVHSAELLMKTMLSFAEGKMKPQAQDEARATFTKKFTSQDAFVDANDLAAAERGNTEKAREIVRKINALNPEPGAWTQKNGKRVKLLSGALQNGALKLSRIQEEGKRPQAC